MRQLSHGAARMIATGTIVKPSRMNKLEEAFGNYLFAQRSEQIVKWFKYEGITLKIGDDCRYTPDFFVMQADNELVCYEIKGPFKRDDSVVKLKAAAHTFPFRFFLVTREEGQWNILEIRP